MLDSITIATVRTPQSGEKVLLPINTVPKLHYTTMPQVTLKEIPKGGAFEMPASVFAELQELPGNGVCVDCGTAAPDWGSPALGILFCFQCSGIHRGLGVHISFVRSVRMDSWTEKQVALMKQGGNGRCNEFLQSHGVTTVGDSTQADRRSAIQQKYDSPAAELYKEVLKAECDGRPVPTELPKKKEATDNTLNRKMEGFGSSPMPRETEDPIPATKILLVAVPLVVAASAWMLSPH